MNDKLRERIFELSSRQLSALEARNQLILARNLGLVLHCSHEIDQSTILYLTVNGLPLIESDAFLFVCSENGLPDEEQRSGHGLFHRVFLYDVIGELVTETLTGHYNFCTCQLDGRLVILVNFSRTLLPGIVDEVASGLKKSCETIICRAAQEYGMKLSFHCSGIVQGIERLSAEYHRLLNEVTYFRYTGMDMTGLITGFDTVPFPTYEQLSRDNRQYAQTCVDTILSGGNPELCVAEVFQTFLTCPPFSIPVLQLRIRTITEIMYFLLGQHTVAVPQRELLNDFIGRIEQLGSLSELQSQLTEVCIRIQLAHRKVLQSDLLAHVSRAEAYMNQHLNDPGLDISQIADFMSMSPAMLNKAFRRIRGETVFARLQQLRLEKSLSLLHSGRTVREISALCGFGSVESYYRTFRKYYQTTPREYRAHSRIEKP